MKGLHNEKMSIHMHFSQSQVLLMFMRSCVQMTRMPEKDERICLLLFCTAISVMLARSWGISS